MFEARMETYSILEKAKSYSGLSLAARDADWLQGYREAPIYDISPKDPLYANVRMFKAKYF